MPQRLWSAYILQMASYQRRSVWSRLTRAFKKPVQSLFPLSNHPQDLPGMHIEDCLAGNSTEFARADLLLCIRTLKVIEQVVYSRTNGTSGPLTVCLSVARIIEVTPSFVSVLNALGLSVSYNKTERSRLSLIAERERLASRAWKLLPGVNESAVPTAQFDNWDIKPLHAVKGDGKQMPKVIGSQLQGILKKRKNVGKGLDASANKRAKLDWKSDRVHGSSSDFADAFMSKDKQKTLQEFREVVFGLIFFYRQRLCGQEYAAGDSLNT